MGLPIIPWVKGLISAWSKGGMTQSRLWDIVREHAWDISRETVREMWRSSQGLMKGEYDYARLRPETTIPERYVQKSETYTKENYFALIERSWMEGGELRTARSIAYRENPWTTKEEAEAWAYELTALNRDTYEEMELRTRVVFVGQGRR